MGVSINHSSSFNAQAYSAAGSCLYSPDSSESLDMAQFAGADDYAKDVVDIKYGGAQLENVVELVMRDLGRQLSPDQQTELRESLLTAGRAAFPV